MPRPVPQHKNNLTRDEFPAGIGYRPDAPRALCFGDSWMQYSPHPTDLNKQLAQVFRRTLFLREGLGGRDRETWHAALPRIGRHIRSYGFAAILLSHGGNDVVGPDMDALLKRPDQPAAAAPQLWPAPPPVVQAHVRQDVFAQVLSQIFADIDRVLDHRDAFSPQTRVFAHTYDYAIPDGRPFRLGPLPLAGPWMQPAMARAGVPDAERAALARWLVDSYADALIAHAATRPQFHIVDSRGTLAGIADWENEIHPTADGFQRIVRGHWVPALAGLLR